MSPGLYALHEGLIDYAGLFPPAALDLDPAVRNFARYRTGADAWMLGRFVLPVGRLGEAEAHAGLFAAAPPARFSVLGPAPEAAPDAWLDGARDALRATREWSRRTDGVLVADRFELKLPASLATDPALADLLSDLDSAYRESGDAGPRAALEVPFLAHPEAVGPAAQAVADANGRTDRPAFALKLRCGGVTPDLVPDVETLARAIVEARDAGVPFKATAGLHHPLPNHDEAVGTRMHGYLGVFGGAVLARLHGLGADDLAEILDDDRAASWSVDDGVAWRSLQASPAEVADGRSQFALSFGSCSFDEPREDLRALRWL